MSGKYPNISGGSYRNYSNQELLGFVQSNFTVKDCNLFQLDPNISSEMGLCRCGRHQVEHSNPLQTDSDNLSWSDKNLINAGSTNAFGYVYFSLDEAADNKSRFIRTSTDDDPVKLVQLLEKKEYWNALFPNRPTLCICLLTAEYSSRISEVKKEKIVHGLTSALQSCDSWFINNGMNISFNILVGKALSEVTTNYFGDSVNFTPPKSIGICPWGCIEGRDGLCNNLNGEQIDYSLTKGNSEGTTYALLPFNSHIILVDDGRVRSYAKFVESEYMFSLQKLFASSSNGDGLCVPLVNVIVGGNLNTLKEAQVMISSGNPLLVCKGSGLAADLIALAWELWHQQDELNVEGLTGRNIRNIKMSALKIGTAEDGDYIISLLRDIIANERLLSIFDIDGEESLKTEIMKLIIVNATDNLGKLYLCLSWRNFDLATDFIFKTKEVINPKKLHGPMLTALLNDQLDFIKLFMELGVNLHDFVTIDVMHSLYNFATDRQIFLTLMKNSRSLLDFKKKYVPPEESLNLSEKISYPLTDAGNSALATCFSAFLKHFADKKVQEYVDALQEDARKLIMHVDSSTVHLLYVASLLVDEFICYPYLNAIPRNFCRAGMTKTFLREPADHLTVWAITHGRQSIALFFLSCSSQPMSLALYGASLCRELSNRIPSYDTKNRDMFKSNADEFEEVALGVLEVCEKESVNMKTAMLTLHLPSWGVSLSPVVAVNSNSTKFTSSKPFQDMVCEMWENGIKFKVGHQVLAMICPLLLLSSGFPIGDPMKSTINKIKNSVPKEYKIPESEDAPPIKIMDPEIFINKLKVFYGSPRTKFAFSLMAMIVFLLIFSFMLLFDFHAEYFSWMEILVTIYSVAWIVDDLNIFVGKSSSSGRKLLQLFNTFPWLISHFITNGIFLIAACLRIRGEVDFVYSRYAYTLLLLLSFMKLLDYMLLSWYFGPLVIMINKMFRQLVTSLITLFVIMVGYGAAVQVMLYPRLDDVTWDLIVGIFYYPYFQLFGELSFDFYRAEAPCNETVEACPKSSKEVIILHAAYMALAVLIFLNLLIAIFSKVFSDLFQYSKDIWMQTHFRVVSYFFNLSSIPQPFSAPYVLVKMLYTLFYYVATNHRKWNAHEFRRLPGFKPDLVENHCWYWEALDVSMRTYGMTAYIHHFQNFCGKKYYENIKKDARKPTNDLFQDLAEKLNELQLDNHVIAKSFEKNDIVDNEGTSINLKDRISSEIMFQTRLKQLRKQIKTSNDQTVQLLSEVGSMH